MSHTHLNKVNYLQDSYYFYHAPSDSWWFFMAPKPRPCMTTTLLSEMTLFSEVVLEYKQRANIGSFMVMSSSIQDVFNLGGDIKYFKEMILEGNKPALLQYGLECIEGMCLGFEISKHLPRICVVNGTALGGGMEMALALDIIIAEEGAKVGFPEIKFNLFPGMGAFSFLSRRIGHTLAKKMIISGDTFLADDLVKNGVIDILAPKGYGLGLALEYIKKYQSKANGYQHFTKATYEVNPVTYQELKNVVELWAEACFGLTEIDLKLIDKLTSKQYEKTSDENIHSAEDILRCIVGNTIKERQG